MDSRKFRQLSYIFVLLGLCLGACQRSGEPVVESLVEDLSAPASVVLISMDTLRADHLGAYGFPDGYSPTFDRLAQGGTVRQSVFTVIPHTTPAHASLLTGRYPVNHGSRDNAFPINMNVPTLAESFRNQGYTTLGSVGHFLLSAKTSGLNRGFQHFASPLEPVSKTGETADGKKVFPVVPNAFRSWPKVNSHVSEWMQSVSSPFFLFLHYYECHAGHSPPAPWKNLADFHPYDGEIAAIDNALIDILRLLSATDQLDSTEIVITADHGESLGEHDYYGHGRLLYNPSMEIPWITFGRGHQGGVIPDLSRIVDIMPTLLASRQIPLPDEIDGIPEARGVVQAFGESPSLYASEPQRRIRSFRDTDYTMIRQLSPRKLELYNRQDDPAETIDLSGQQSNRSRQYETRLNDFISTDKQAVLKPETKLQPAVVEALKSLGYLE